MRRFALTWPESAASTPGPVLPQIPARPMFRHSFTASRERI